jgi:hypothetical protein
VPCTLPGGTKKLSDYEPHLKFVEFVRGDWEAIEVDVVRVGYLRPLPEVRIRGLAEYRYVAPDAPPPPKRLEARCSTFLALLS